MPDFTISLNSNQATRVASAYSFLNEDGNNASAAQVIVWILEEVRLKVLERERIDARGIVDSQVEADMRAEGWN